MAFVATMVLAPPTLGQLVWGADAMVRKRYEWRGLTRSSNWVLQPDAFVRIGGHTTSITAGVWTSYGLGADGPEDIGFGRGFFRETDVWGELATVLFGHLDVSFGWAGYWFRVDSTAGAIPRLRDTHELYIRLSNLSLPVIVPELSVFQDIDAVRGTYAEGSVAIRIPVWPRLILPIGSIDLKWTTGVAFNQSRPPPDLAYYDSDGITHHQLGIATAFGPLNSVNSPFTMALHVAWQHQWNIDGQTKMTSAVRSRGYHHWMEFGLSLWGPRCRPSRRICP
jgi:hypothetical protein